MQTAAKVAQMNPAAGNPSSDTAAHNASGGVPTADQATDALAKAQAAIEDAMSSARRTIEQNPTLALAGAVALGAVAVLVIRNRAAARDNGMQRFQRNMDRQVRHLRRAVRQELRDSGLSSRFEGLGDTLSGIDLKPYIRPFLEQAADMAGKAKTRLSEAAK